MKITQTAVKYRTSIIVMTLLLVLGGLFSYNTLPKESTPSIEIPNIVVTTLYPGASPDDVESLITQPLEQELQGINGIDEITSTSTEGVSSIVIAFTPDVSMDEAHQQVRDKTDAARPDLPADVEAPMVNEIDVSQFPILTVNLAGEYPLSRLKEVAEGLQDEIEKIPGVLEVNLIGGLDRAVQVDVDLTALQAYNLTIADIAAAIQGENANIPGGSVDVDRLNYLVRVDGQLDRPEAIASLIVGTPGGVPVYVRDVADVTFGYEDPQSYARLKVLRAADEDGTLHRVGDTDYAQVVSLSVKKRPGENIIETADAVRRTLDTYPVPNGTQVLVTGDQSEQVEAMVTDLENNIISGLLFVVAVLLFFMGVRNALLVGIAIPLSMLASFVVLQAMGLTLNFVILFSLIIALGMLVDNAIVIVENIYRYLEEGHGRWEAVRRGTGEVGGAVVASTLTTVAAFVPMLFWPGLIGEFMSFLPLTLIITLTCSLFVALVINPVVTGFFMEAGTGAEERAVLSPWARRTGLAAVGLAALVVGLANPITLGVLVGGGAVLYVLHRYVLAPMGERFIQTGMPRLVAQYRRFLDWMLRRDYTVRRAYLRNAFALAGFLGGLLLLALGGLVAAFAGTTAALVLLVPGGVLAAVGVLAILVHTVEVLFLGGRTTVKAGLGLAVVAALVVGLRALGSGVTPAGAGALLALPLLIVAAGVLGLLFGRGRTTLLLTDNRARLLNGVMGALVAITALFVVAPTGVAFFPETDPNQVQVTVEGPLGTNLEAGNRLARTVQERLDTLLGQHRAAEQNVENVVVSVGVGGDARFGGGAASAERSRLTLNLVDYADRGESSEETLARIRAGLDGLPGAEIEITKDQMGPSTGPAVNIEITGADYDEIVRQATALKRHLREGADAGRLPGLVDVRDNLNAGRPELQVRIDRERAARFGLSTRQVASTIRAALSGTTASTFRDGEEEYDIVVRLAEQDRQSLERLRDLTIHHGSTQVPLTAVADFELGSGLGSITRKDLQRVVTVQADVAPGYNAQAVLGSVQAYLTDFTQAMPAGYSLAYTGQNQDQQESFGFLTTALLIGVALIFLILIAQFNSVGAPLLIMAAVAQSLIGVLLGLIATGTPFSLFTFIGVISLAGIVVNNAIVLVDYTMQLRRQGVEKRAAVVEAGATRLRPVLLTALTTVLGLIPLTFGINVDFVGLLTELRPAFQIGSENTQFWGPMGTAIISGLTFATFLTLVIVPVMYSLMDSVSVAFAGLWQHRTKRGRHAVPAAPRPARPHTPAREAEPRVKEA